MLIVPVLIALAGCGSGPISTSADASTTDMTATGATTTGTDTGEVPFEPSPEQLEEIEAVEGELAAIVDGALAYFVQSHPNEEDPTLAEHLCPYPQGQPVGGEAGITPDININCNEGPNTQCVPLAGGGGEGYYDAALWEYNSVWIAAGFEKTEPHSFHYNLIAINDVTGYGACAFTAQAFADLDDDAIFSTYERRGRVDEGGSFVEELFIDKPWE